MNCHEEPNGGINVAGIVRRGEHYLLFFTDEYRSQALRTLGRWASNPELSFDWSDAANVAHGINTECMQMKDTVVEELERCAEELTATAEGRHAIRMALALIDSPTFAELGEARRTALVKLVSTSLDAKYTRTVHSLMHAASTEAQ